MLSFGFVELAPASFGVVAAGGAIGAGVDGHAGAPLSTASEAPFVPVRGGTPSGDWPKLFAAPARGGTTGPSLIFT